jgi:recombination protein RecA
MACPSYGGGIRFAHDFDKEKIMALETKPAKDPAAEDKHELDPKRKAALDTALAQVEKSFGKGSAMRLGDQPEQNVEVIPTGSLALDMALGIGGLPKGRIVEIYGPESSGKTTLALHVVANAQKKGGVAAYIDAEHALDPAYARKLGVDTDSLIVSQPDNGEQALEIADMLIRSGAEGRNRRRNGRQPCWFAGPTHESGAAQDDRRVGSGRHHRHLHQPAA